MATRPDTDRVRPDELDAVIHERVRLAIVSALAARRSVDYLELRTLLQVTDGNLAGHIRVLENAGYVAVKKTFVGRKTRTAYRLTPAGRKAFQTHVGRLAQMLRLTERA